MPEPANSQKFYSPLAAIAWVILIFIGSQILAALIAGVLILVFSANSDQTTGWFDSNWGQFSFIILAQAITIRFTWEILKRRHISWQTIGLKKPKLLHVGYAIAGFAAYFVTYLFVVGFAISVIPGLDVEQQQDIGFSRDTAGLALLPVFISLVLLPPLVEEIVARGFLYTNLRSKMTFLTATTVTSILFAAAHLGGGLVGEGLLWVAAIDTFVLSIVMCYLREKTGSLWPAMGVHFIKNSIAFIVLFNIAQYFR